MSESDTGYLASLLIRPLRAGMRADERGQRHTILIPSQFLLRAVC